MDDDTTGPSPLTRRTFLTALGAAAGSGLVPVTQAHAAEAADSLSGGRSISAAMHVHGSWSEGVGSWESQFAQASQSGVDLLCMTDHDHRALAFKYLPHLRGARFERRESGAAELREAGEVGGGFRLLVESAGGGPASAGLEIEPRPQALNRLRTNIGGTVLRHTWAAWRLDPGTTYEVVVGLSLHEAHGDRPRGELELRYRFGDGQPGRSLDRRGLTGIVSDRPPAPGAVSVLRPEEDIAALWPDLLAFDNGFTSLAFVATSPQRGAIAEVTVQGMVIDRNDANERSFVRQQQRIVDVYARQFPKVTGRPGVEISQQEPHVNVYGVPQFLPDQSRTTQDNFQAYYVQMVRSVHSQGGLVSYNHPFGANKGPVLSAAAQADKRRSLFAQLRQNDLYGTDILEVGYSVRGQVTLGTHLDLWDTFSRHGRFLTGNGVNDDHQGKHWGSLDNGFATGIWADSTSNTAVMRALRGGRAFAKHLGNWKGGQLDMLVDGSVPMGKVSVRDTPDRSRKLAVYIDGLAGGGTVELVQGAVDYRGDDPKTFVLDRVPASAFRTGSKTVVRTVDTTSSCFVRAQVRNERGTLIGVGNPVWLLREPPKDGIPPGRRV
ncbi:MAG TPA: CehA/McbA family metallohydrolase [Mycobacteriales bacterium]|nr:CehA/McbA family metallohydrolase [Mycobacteriales bacterium]